MGFISQYPDYVVDASSGIKETEIIAQKMIDEAEVVVLGSAPFSLLRTRLLLKKLTFRYSEHLWKQYKHYLKTPIYIMDNLRTRESRMLCASAFASQDYNAMGAFIGRCYKWGYFPEIKSSIRINTQRYNTPVHLMWCSRFLNWKHPELPIFMAKRLKDKGCAFILDMYGSGRYLVKSKKLVDKLDVGDIVKFHGNMANEEILEGMRRSDIFLFTSDKGEGWGVVANESMSCGCVLVASDSIGSVPFLVKDSENGCIFNGPSRRYGFNRFGGLVDRKSLISLTEKVEWLLNNPQERFRISRDAIRTIEEFWNPRVAAKNLLLLIDDIQNGRETSISVGPCSRA